MPLKAGHMLEPVDSLHRGESGTGALYVVERRNHRVSKWIHTPGQFDFRLAAGEIDLTMVPLIIQGTGYQVGDQVVFPEPNLDIADPIQAEAEVSSVGGGGQITGIQVNNIGNGYSGIGNKGFNLQYGLTISDVSQINIDEQSITVTYTISDDLTIPAN